MDNIKDLVISMESMSYEDRKNKMFSFIAQGKDSLNLLPYLKSFEINAFLEEYSQFYFSKTSGVSKSRGKILGKLGASSPEFYAYVDTNFMIEIILSKMDSLKSENMTTIAKEIYPYFTNSACGKFANIFYHLYLYGNRSSLKEEIAELVNEIFLLCSPEMKSAILECIAEACGGRYFHRRLSPRDPDYKKEIKTWFEIVCNLIKLQSKK